MAVKASRVALDILLKLRVGCALDNLAEEACAFSGLATQKAGGACFITVGRRAQWRRGLDLLNNIGARVCWLTPSAVSCMLHEGQDRVAASVYI